MDQNTIQMMKLFQENVKKVTIFLIMSFDHMQF